MPFSKYYNNLWGITPLTPPPPPSPWETAVVWTLMAKLVMGTSWEAKLIKVTFWVAYSNEDFTQKKALSLRVNMFNTKVLTGDTIFRSPTGD